MPTRYPTYPSRTMEAHGLGERVHGTFTDSADTKDE